MSTFWLVTAGLILVWFGALFWIICVFKSGNRFDEAMQTRHYHRWRANQQRRKP